MAAGVAALTGGALGTLGLRAGGAPGGFVTCTFTENDFGASFG